MITDVETLWIFSRDFQQLLKSHHSIARSYTMAMQHTLSKFEKRFEEISFFDVPLRILNFIEEWARNDGIEDEGWILLPNIYSQEDIASFLFCSRQSVSYFFRKMKESNMLKYSRSIMKVKKGFGEILSETKDVDGAMKATFLHNPPGMPCR
jgi:CRP-like cAMP-binding protein